MLLHPCISEGSVCCSIWYAWLYLLHIIQNNWYLECELRDWVSFQPATVYHTSEGSGRTILYVWLMLALAFAKAFYSQLWSSYVLWEGSRLAYFSELHNLLPTWNWETLAKGCFCCSLMMTEAFMFAKRFQFQERAFFPFMLVSVEKPANFQRQMRSYWTFFAVIHLIPFSLRELSLYRYVHS